MIEIGHAMSQLDRMMVREQMAERAQVDSLSVFQCLSDQEVGSWAWLPSCGEMLADPRLLEAEAVEAFDLVEVQLLAVSDWTLGRMRRH